MNTATPLPPRVRRWVTTILILLWLGAFTATHIPGPKLPEMHVSDKSLHVIGFLGLAAAFLLTLRAYGTGRLHRDLLVLFVMMTYAAVDEATQPYFQRTADMDDWLADIAGTVIALVVWEGAAALLSRRGRARPG